MKKLLLVGCFIVLLAGSAAAQSITLADIGTVELPPGVIVTPTSDGYTIRGKDGAVWRSMEIMKHNIPAPPDEESNKALLPILGNDLTTHGVEALFPGMITIAATPAKQLILNGKDSLRISMKCDVQGLVANMDYLLVAEPSGVNMFIFVCADCDLPYWHPLIPKITALFPQN